MQEIKVSVVIVCFNEELNIGGCLDSVLNQDYKDYEIIVVDGNSTDRTREIVSEYRKRHENIRMIVNPKRTIASNRNTGVKHAKGACVAFTDADCIAPSDWLSILVKGFVKYHDVNPKVAAVGGGNIPPANANNFLAALGIVQDSFPGSLGSVQGTRYKEPRVVPSLAALNALYERDKIEEAGLFDESLGNMCEDADINYRLNKEGYLLVYLPESYVVHKFRSTPGKWAQRMFAYGAGRARLIRKHRSVMRFVYLLPLAFILIMLSAALSLMHNAFSLPLLYFPFIGLYSVYKCVKAGKPLLAPYAVCIYISQHFAYAVGELYGFFRSYNDGI